MFKDHSNSLEMALAGTSRVFRKLQAYSEDGSDKTDITQRDSIFRSLMEKYALSEKNINNFKNLYSKNVIDPPLQMFVNNKDNSFDFDILNDGIHPANFIQDALANYPFKYEIIKKKVVLTNIPIFVRKLLPNEYGGSTPQIRKLEYVIYKGERLDYSDELFYSKVLNEPHNITKVEYSPYKTVNNLNQSIFTYKIEEETAIEENNNELPSCNTSFE